MVAAARQQAGEFARNLDFPVAQSVEDIFRLVREGLDEMAFDDARGAFDRVGGAEDAVDVVVVVGLLLQLQQAVFHGLQLFAAFLDENAGEFVHVLASGLFAGGNHHRVAKKSGQVAEIERFADCRAVGDDGHGFLFARSFLFGEDEQLQAGRGDFAHLRQVGSSPLPASSAASRRSLCSWAW